MKGDPFVAVIESRRVLVEGVYYSSVEAVKAVEVANAVPGKRSIKAIPNIILWLFILTKTFTVLFMLIYPGSTRKIYKECGDYLTHGICREKKYY